MPLRHVMRVLQYSTRAESGARRGGDCLMMIASRCDVSAALRGRREAQEARDARQLYYRCYAAHAVYACRSYLISYADYVAYL